MPIDRSGPRLGNMEEGARTVARMIDQTLEAHTGERVGFMLFAFNFGPRGFTTYISNSKRDDMRRAVTEWLEKEGGAVHDEFCPHSQRCTCGEPVALEGP